ncbi:hypothetical protein U8527_14205 [Kordia algicida OT-1]|uniref:Lipoprotein n=1 Tax=Kordia algicida OT-1 TaxID=391587 RepID=A9DXX1_9FLAO|nr:hypothetical protein [Kordia algicida]EDP96057.1 hypothetical protein KAOT1_07808 [Kordia algicida OT-1]
MRQIVKTLLLLLVLASCNNEKIREMEDQIEVYKKDIASLKQQNKILKDSLNYRTYEKLKNTLVSCFPVEKDVFVGKSNTIIVQFYENWKLPPYDVYQVTKNGKEVKKDLILKDQTGFYYEIDFHPNTIQEDLLELETVFKIDSQPLVIKSRVNFDVKYKK